MDYAPDILEIAEKYNEDPEVVAESRMATPEQFRIWVEDYLKEGENRPAHRRLFLARDLAIPYLLDVLDRPDAFVSFPDAQFGRESPASLVLDLMPWGEIESLKPYLRKGIQVRNSKTFSQVVRHLAYYGSNDTVEELRALAREDSKAAEMIRSGALHAIKEDRCQTLYRQFIWDFAVELLHSENPPSGHDPTRHLIILNPEKAKELFESSEVLRVDHKLLPEILSKLNTLNAPPSPEFLIAQIEHPNPQLREHRQEDLRRVAIGGLIRHGHPAALKYVEDILSHAYKHSDDMVLAAWRARFKIHGLVPILEKISVQENSKLPGELDPVLRGLQLLEILEISVSQNGFSSWFQSTDAACTREVLETMKQIRADRHKVLLEKACEVFGPSGPALGEEERMSQVDNLTDAQEEVLDQLTCKWDDLPFWQFYVFRWDWNRQRRRKK